jgi:hypothetical protein
MKAQLLGTLLLLVGCAAPVADNLLDECVHACEEALPADLESGPCLLDPMHSDSSWVCDVAHEPRLDVDNAPENQCSAYRQGRAMHFIELSPRCELIRKI